MTQLGANAYSRFDSRRIFHKSRVLVLIVALLMGLGAVDLIWLPFSNVAVAPSFWIDTASIVVPLGVLWASLGAMRYQLRKTPFRYRGIVRELAGRTEALVGNFSVVTLFSVGLLLFSYLASATSRPLMDKYLAAGDAALHFDWVAYVGGLNNHPWIAAALSQAYFSLKIQLLLPTAILAFTGRSGRLLEYAAHFGLAGCLTCLIAMAVPAAGTLYFYHPSPDLLSAFAPGAGSRHLEQLYALRTQQPFLIEHPEGLITFPSFHSALAVIFVYSVRGIRFVALPVFLLDAMLLLATPAEGGHHLVDILAGVLIAAAAIQSVRLIGGAGALRSANSFRAGEFEGSTKC
ncbi:phosphatase PAP2 family protein [Mesorhizobium opportunistum]|uniref:phosphatase PAP2 family protein n=1 Tax=Mesorhizobium opportunistum TaxID=593909 RepID=UPI000A048345|nr:phosphatase PAP2 family protein [Mesorhizobium opportunistum]